MFGLSRPILDPASQSLLTAMETPAETQFREELAWHYYKGDVYKWLRQNNSLQAQREKKGKHQEIAVYFNPVKEIVDTDVSKVFAMPVRGEELSTEIDTRLNALWTRSKFASFLRQYVQAGAAQGSVYIQIIDGPVSTLKVRRADEMDVVRHPQTGEIVLAKLTEMVFDPLGIEGDQTNPGVATGRLDTYRYDFIMTPGWYATLRNGKPWAFSDNPKDANGKLLSQWPNRLGLVPVIEVLHQDDGDGQGQSAWEAIQDTIDGTNQVATFMANTVKMHIDPLIVVYGVDSGEVEKKILNGQTNVFYIKFPEDPNQTMPPRIELLEWKGNISDVTGFIQWVKDRLVDVVPELQLARIQEQANPSGYSVALQSQRVTEHILDLRSNYAERLVHADRLALWAEDVHTGRVDGLNARSRLEDETEYKHRIACGDILPKNVAEESTLASKMFNDGVIDKLEYLLRSGYSLPQAQEIIKRQEEEAQQAMIRQMGVMQSQAEMAALAAKNPDNSNPNNLPTPIRRGA